MFKRFYGIVTEVLLTLKHIEGNIRALSYGVDNHGENMITLANWKRNIFMDDWTMNVAMELQDKMLAASAVKCTIVKSKRRKK